MDSRIATCAATVLFREGYGDPSPEPRVFVHPKIAGSVPDVSPIESVLTPLASDMARAASAGASAPHSSRLGAPSANGHLATAADQEALVQTITDQVMRALNGTAR